MERAIAEINDLKPDIVVCSGDLTTFGFKEEYARRSATSTGSSARRSSSSRATTTRATSATCTSRSCSATATRCSARAGVTVVAVDSTEPDLDHGQIGRGRYGWIEEQFAAEPSDLRVFVLHHHLLPIPGHGPRAERRLRRGRRDRVPAARGRASRALRAQARAVRVEAREPLRRQHGHRLDAPSPRATRDPVTTSSRSRARTSAVWRRYPFHGQERIIQFDIATGEYEKYTGRIEHEVTAKR